MTRAVRRPRILAYAYDIEPDRGSEPGAGWASVRILAGFADVTVLTRHRPPGADGSFAPWTSRLPEGDWIHFVPVMLPGDPTSLDTKGLPARWSRQAHVGYFVWQVLAIREARRLHAAEPFDLTWHLTWANGWFGSTSRASTPRSSWADGGGVAPPWRLVAGLGVRGLTFELARGVARIMARRLNPLAHRSWRRARLILVRTGRRSSGCRPAPGGGRGSSTTRPSNIRPSARGVVRPATRRSRCSLAGSFRSKAATSL